MTLPQMPHLGSTGVIQNPGDIGAIAESLQGLPGILLAAQNAARQRAQEALNAQLTQAQIANFAHDNARQDTLDALTRQTNSGVGDAFSQLFGGGAPTPAPAAPPAPAPPPAQANPGGPQATGSPLASQAPSIAPPAPQSNTVMDVARNIKDPATRRSFLDDPTVRKMLDEELKDRAANKKNDELKVKLAGMSPETQAIFGPLADLGDLLSPDQKLAFQKHLTDLPHQKITDLFKFAQDNHVTYGQAAKAIGMTADEFNKTGLKANATVPYGPEAYELIQTDQGTFRVPKMGAAGQVAGVPGKPNTNTKATDVLPSVNEAYDTIQQLVRANKIPSATALKAAQVAISAPTGMTSAAGQTVARGLTSDAAIKWAQASRIISEAQQNVLPGGRGPHSVTQREAANGADAKYIGSVVKAIQDRASREAAGIPEPAVGFTPAGHRRPSALVVPGAGDTPP